MSKNLCIIPARGGSKRIPRKNIKNFLGKPIIAYSIKAALDSGIFDEVMVSTEDEEIAEIAKKYGAKVPFLRSQKNASDFAITMDVLKEVIEEYKKSGQDFEVLCCLYPCAPFVSEEKLQNAYKRMIEADVDRIFTVIPFNFPIQRALKIENNKPSYFFPEYENIRSQDVIEAFHDAGQFYLYKVSQFERSSSLISNNTEAYKISEMEAQDIDNEADWQVAELKFKRLYNK